MKITISCDVLGEENNGTTIASMNLIRSLISKGHEVRILCCDQNRKGQDDYYIVPVRSFGIFNGYVSKNGVTLAKPDDMIIEEALTGVDIVHIMQPFSLGNRTAKLAKRMGIPISAGFHTQAENVSSHVFMLNNSLINRAIYLFIYRKLYSTCDCIHYPSQFIRNTFENIVGGTNGYVISNGVNQCFVRKDIKKPEKYHDKFVILFTGRYSKEKSHRVLIDAVKLSKYSGRIQLIFAGDGPCKKALMKYCARNLKIQPVFQLYPREELIQITNYSDLYVHPAEIEIEAIACLEAITCGIVPVIANSERCATKAFALGNHNLFENRNSKDLAEKIDYWFDHPEEKKKCSKGYLGYAKKFDQELCMNEMEHMLYDAIMNHKRKENAAVRELKI